jgi:hypothetical protein
MFAFAAGVSLTLSGVAIAGEASGEWVSLFNGQNLEGWKASEHSDACRVEAGKIVLQGDRSHLFYTGPVSDHDFKNFVLQCEVQTKPGANSGIYFHTEYQQTGWPRQGYEAQINNSHSDAQRTGSLYAVAPVEQAPADDNEWFTYTIRVDGNRVVTKVDGQTLVQYVEPDELDRPDGWEGRKLSSGTIAFQAHDPGSEVWIRNVKIRELE